jgi:1-acyl-sn-glycerol-3-phosphate acyltransferase
MPEWVSNCWYDFCSTICWTTLTVGFSLRTEGTHHVPRRGPVLIIANHESFLDPPAVGVACGRRLSYLARKSLFTESLVGKLVASLRSVPVDQEGVPTEGLRTVLELLEKGEGVLIFPEGERTWTGEMQPLKPGIVLLVRRALPTVVPVGIAGAFDALPRNVTFPRFSPIFMPPTGGDMAVSIGKPIDGKRLAALSREEILSTLYDEIQKMRERAQRMRRKK